MKKLYIILVLTYSMQYAAAQSWNITGNSGTTSANFIGTTDNRALVFKAKNKERGRIDATGFWRFGSVTNYVKIDSGGVLTFNGNGAYQVAGNKYVFQYLDNPAYGLFFNSTIPQYEFRNTKADPVFYVNADNGNGMFLGNLKIGAYTLPAVDGTNGQVLSTNGAGAVSWSTTANGANKPLSNLSATTAVNVNLLPGTDNTLNLGSSTKGWKDLYISGKFFMDGQSFLENTGTNTFIGTRGNGSNTGGYNTATGYYALATNTTGSNNAAFGYNTLIYNSTGSFNTAFGRGALSAISTGSDNNTAIGANSISSNNSGSCNTAVGESSLATIYHGSYNTMLGFSADGSDENLDNSIAIGAFAVASANNQAVIGSTSVTSIGGYANWTNFSDGRYKQNIKRNVPGLVFINKLKPVTYTINVNAINTKLHRSNQSKELNAKEDQSGENILHQSIIEKSKIIYTGFVAQEVAKAAEELHYDFSGVDKPKDENKSFYGLRYGDFVVPLVKAVQELSQQNDELKKRNDQLAARLDKIEKLLSLSSQNINNESISPQAVEISAAAKLEQNIPNPFTNSTTINYYLPVNNSNAHINFYNVSGALMKSVKLNNSGKGSIQLKTKELPAGTYQYTLVIDNKIIDTKKYGTAKIKKKC